MLSLRILKYVGLGLGISGGIYLVSALELSVPETVALFCALTGYALWAIACAALYGQTHEKEARDDE